mmetsp:Transcript_17060/g.57632  ORF Transcript_17060/g.57632 Transcript_17060/m.57632 type:complete len:224 (+) Transcript_17060:124-795(+)
MPPQRGQSSSSRTADSRSSRSRLAKACCSARCAWASATFTRRSFCASRSHFCASSCSCCASNSRCCRAHWSWHCSAHCSSAHFIESRSCSRCAWYCNCSSCARRCSSNRAHSSAKSPPRGGEPRRSTAGCRSDASVFQRCRFAESLWARISATTRKRWGYSCFECASRSSSSAKTRARWLSCCCCASKSCSCIRGRRKPVSARDRFVIWVLKPVSFRRRRVSL